MSHIEFRNILDVDNKLQEKVRNWRNSSEVRNYMINQEIISKEHHFRWIENLKKNKHIKFWLIFFDNKPIGAVYLTDIDYDKLSSYWGFYIGDIEYRGKGFGKKVLFKLLSMFFDEMKYQTLFTEVLSNNKAALNIYEKFMFKEIQDEASCYHSEIITLNFLKEDWDKNNVKIKNECNQ